MTVLDARPTAGQASTSQPGPRRGRRISPSLIGVLPFFVLVLLFLLIPTLTVLIGAFVSNSSSPTLANVDALRSGDIVDSFVRSIELSAITAIIGAVVGALFAYVVSTANREGLLRRVVTSASGVLAQFGGVMLAFAFVALIGLQGFVTVFLQQHLGINIYGGGVWLFELGGLILVYSYFQIPLMLIVFLPAMDGLRVQWREATESLGGSTWQFWRHVAGPLLAPAFLGSTLLLFANAFSAYATAAALISQGQNIAPLQIRTALTSEVVLGQANVGKALALAMVVIVALVMFAYARLQRRTSKWLG